jgi:hypothetical protein
LLVGVILEMAKVGGGAGGSGSANTTIAFSPELQCIGDMLEPYAGLPVGWRASAALSSYGGGGYRDYRWKCFSCGVPRPEGSGCCGNTAIFDQIIAVLPQVGDPGLGNIVTKYVEVAKKEIKAAACWWCPCCAYICCLSKANSLKDGAESEVARYKPSGSNIFLTARAACSAQVV